MGKYISVQADAYIGDFDDAAVVSEAISRGYKVVASPLQIEKLTKQCRDIRDLLEDRSPSFEQELERIRDAIVERRSGDALVAIDRLLDPKFKDVAACRNQYEHRSNAA